MSVGSKCPTVSGLTWLKGDPVSIPSPGRGKATEDGGHLAPMHPCDDGWDTFHSLGARVLGYVLPTMPNDHSGTVNDAQSCNCSSLVGA